MHSNIQQVIRNFFYKGNVGGFRKRNNGIALAFIIYSTGIINANIFSIIFVIEFHHELARDKKGYH